MNNIDSRKPHSRSSGRLTLLCIASFIPVWLTAVFGPQSGMETMIILLPLFAMLVVHVTVGPCALFLVWREPGLIDRILVTGYFVLFSAVCLGLWAESNEIPLQLRTKWRDFAHPSDAQLVESIRTNKNEPSAVESALQAGAQVDRVTPEQRTPLIEATIYQKLEVMEILLKGGADPNQPAADGTTALFIAVSGLNPDLAGILLKAGADPNKTEDYQTPLCRVLRRISTSRLAEPQRELVELLISAGADANLVCNANNSTTAYQLAVHYGMRDVVSLLLGVGQKISRNQVHDEFGNALQDAVRQQQRTWIQQLLQAGVDPDARTRNGRPALVMAIGAGSLDLTKLLLDNGADPKNRQYVYQIARLSTDRPDLLQLLLAAGAAVDDRIAEQPGALYHAIRMNRLEQVQLLLEAGADGNIRNSKQEPLLIHLQQGSMTPDRRKIIGALLDGGADPDIRDSKGRTPFIVSIQRKHLGLAELFYAKGASLDARDDTGLSAVHHAVLLYDAEKVVDWLVDIGADFSLPDNQGRSAVCLAVTKPRSNALRALTNVGISQLDCGETLENSLIDAVSSRHTMSVELLLEFGADPNVRTNHGMSVLEEAARRSFFEGFTVLLRAMANPDTLITNGAPLTPYTNLRSIPWRYPEKRGLPRIPISILTGALLGGYTELIEPLLQAGADPNIKDAVGNTPLLALSAAMPGTSKAYEAVKQLVQGGADPYFTNSQGYSALTLAASRDRLRLLLAFGEAGVDLNRKDDRQHNVVTLLAGKTNQVEQLRKLINLGAKATPAALEKAQARRQRSVTRVLQRAL